MQALLLERSLNNISWQSLLRVQNELSYSRLLELSSEETNSFYPVKFPERCHPSGINSLDIDKQENRFILSGGSDSSIKLWDLNQTIDEGGNFFKNFKDVENFQNIEINKKTIKSIASIPRRMGHEFGISCIKWWPLDNGLFISSSFDNTIKVWDTNNFKEAYSFDISSKIYDFDISSTGEHSLIASANESSLIRLLDLKTTSNSHTLSGHRGKILAVKWSPTNPNILASGGVDGELKIWDIRRAKSCVCNLDQFRVDGATNTAETVNFSPQKKRRLESGVEYNIDNDYSNLVKTAHNGPINSILFNDAGDNLISLGNDEKIKIWDLKQERGVNKLINFGPLLRNQYPQHLSLALSPKIETEQQYLWFPSDNGEILVFNTSNGKLINRLNRKTNVKTFKDNTHGVKGNNNNNDQEIGNFLGKKLKNGYALNNQRTTSIVYGGKNTCIYYSGSLDGKITIWGPQINTPYPQFGYGENIDDIDYLKDKIQQEQQEQEHQEHGRQNILDQIHNEMEAKKRLAHNPFS
ncbi:hypothetical protein PACTADRAFT_50082 [Pachysolen tannophilus NRRL Y-2460]|uniref:Uncharacterized protein n=1 Tax=Pachysolen tannophilus NRRL Y-2460 TaxID=669874 RepID=A0A1E4TUD1_PACTA|nr:hypothetical protein PACTADRAFT_50082 [Pachysolen tannophilus NRRL Y-2460]